MKNMIRVAVASLALIGLMATTNNANAMAVGDANYLGLINDCIPSSLTDEAGYINDLITLAAGASATTIGTETYNRINSTLAGPFSAAVVTGAGKYDLNDGDPPNKTLPGSFKYILGKYDAGNAGGLVWYFPNGISGTVELPKQFNVNGTKYGLSHISWFNQGPSVPDGGTTAMLLGVALSGLAMLRRFVN